MKHAGDAVASAALADEARCMDLADRYINSDCVKRMLQADQVLEWCPFSFQFLHVILFRMHNLVTCLLSLGFTINVSKMPLEGGLGRKNGSFVHKRWRPA